MTFQRSRDIYVGGSFTRTAAPSGTVISLDDLKDHLRVEHTADDQLLMVYLDQATQVYEERSGRTLLTQTWRWDLDAAPTAPVLEIPKAPLQSITQIQYLDEAGALQVFSSSLYTVDTGTERGRVALNEDETWPTVQAGTINVFRTTFVAGYGDAEDVPEAIKQWIRLFVAHLYEAREPYSTMELTAIANGLDTIMASTRSYRFV